MSWLFSRALVAAFSVATSLDGALSAPSSVTPTPQAFLSPDRTTEFSRPSRFGMTFAPLTESRGKELLTWFLGGFPAKTSPLQGEEQDLTGNDQDCGNTWLASLAKFDPATSSWRTAQRSLLGDSDESSVIWPRSGMTADGQCWELPMSEHRTSATGSGLWPTPTASQARSEGMILQMRSLVDQGILDRAEAEAMISGSLTPARMQQWPTPTATDHLLMKGSETLEAWKERSAKKKEQGINLQFALRHAVQEAHERNSKPLSEQIGGSLNPTWVEWLMGWPLGWTDLKPLAMDRFRQWFERFMSS